MSSPAQRLGDAVKARRESELRWSQLEVHANGGPSNTKQTEIENGRLANLTPGTERKLDKGLRWMPGSARLVWDGIGDAVPLSPPSADMLAKIEASNLSAADKERLRQMLAATTPDQERKRDAS